MIRGTMNALDKSQKVNIELREKPSMTRTQEFDKVLDKVYDKVHGNHDVLSSARFMLY